MNMKVLFLTTALVLTTLCMPAWAQLNPKPGFIITNENDTVYGNVDFRSDTRNGQTCSFCADGSTTYQSYSPTDIKGYRFIDNGSFFVSRTFTIDQQPKTIFAEYLLKGGVSLFYHTEGEQDYYFIVGEDGQVLEIKDDNLSITDFRQDYAKKVRQRRTMMAELPRVFSKDVETCKTLWMMEFSPKEMTRAVRRYDELFCTDAGDCIEFQYDEKHRKVLTTHFWATIGYRYDQLTVDEDPADYHGHVPQLALGCDFGFPQYIKGLFLRIGLSLSRFNFPDTKFYRRENGEQPTLTSLETFIGAGYRLLPDKAVCPYVVADASLLGGLFFPKTKKRYYWGGQWQRDESIGQYHSCSGYRLGVGVDIKKHIKIEAAYRKSSSDILKQTGFYLNAGLRL